MNIIELRRSLLNEAQSSPNLLSDLAGLESYIAESYNNRSFIELLQNADDAGATKFKIIKNGDFLFIANNGRIFNEQDLESLCRSASSNKVRGETIGYRGIGFKSVVGFAKEIHILSGDYEITFSKERTKSEIPNATRVPLIRVPHSLYNETKELLSPITNNLLNENFTTIFVFSGVTAQEIHLEFDSFDTTSLMFLRNISKTEFYTSEIRQTKISKEKVSDSEIKLIINNDGNYSEWQLYTSNNCTIAYSLKDGKIQKMSDTKSLVYAFLPTVNISGLGVLINGDFSTDPSRKHIIFDDRSNETIKHCSSLILNIIEEKIANYNSENYDIINALIPFSDPRILQFKKTSFDKLLIEGLKNENSKIFYKLRLCPNWLNASDYTNLLKKNGKFSINGKYLSIDGFVSLAKFLGAKEDNFLEMLKFLDTSLLSTLGCAQFVVQIFKGVISGSLKPDNTILGHKLFIVKEHKYSLTDLKANELKIDENFISLMVENGLTEFEIKTVFKQCKIQVVNATLLFFKFLF